MPKETDSRISELTKLWCEQIYKEKYGVMHAWSAKDAKLMQRCLAWADSSFGPTHAKDKIEDGLRAFLQDPSEYLQENKHPFASYAAAPHKWAKIPKPEAKPEISYAPVKEKRFADDFFEQEMERINKDPLQYFKGFCITGSLLKKISPLNYEKVRNYLVELIGKERSIRLWHENRAKSSIQI